METQLESPHELLTAPLVPFPYTINARDVGSRNFRENAECILMNQDFLKKN